jgi:hypothetical protein
MQHMNSTIYSYIIAFENTYTVLDFSLSWCFWEIGTQNPHFCNNDGTRQLFLLH